MLKIMVNKYDKVISSGLEIKALLSISDFDAEVNKLFQETVDTKNIVLYNQWMFTALILGGTFFGKEVFFTILFIQIISLIVISNFKKLPIYQIDTSKKLFDLVLKKNYPRIYSEMQHELFEDQDLKKAFSSLLKIKTVSERDGENFVVGCLRQILNEKEKFNKDAMSLGKKD